MLDFIAVNPTVVMTTFLAANVNTFAKFAITLSRQNLPGRGSAEARFLRQFR
jgi:hypothetical protein